MTKYYHPTTGNEISHQRYYQIKKREKGLYCMYCTEPIVSKSGLCLKHLIKNREWMRKLRGCKRRNHSLSYHLEKVG
jgi:hypothetical protein